MEVEKKQLKNLFKRLVENENSVLFAVDKINVRILDKVKKSLYDKDQVFYKLFKKLEDQDDDGDDDDDRLQIPFYTPFIE